MGPHPIDAWNLLREDDEFAEYRGDWQWQEGVLESNREGGIASEVPLPAQAKLRGQTRIADIYDKGKAALLLLEMSASDEQGEPLYTNRMSLFLRGEGGFGGPSGPKVGNEPPEREPVVIVFQQSLQ